MQIIFKHKDLEVTKDIKEYTINKLDSISNYIKNHNSVLEIDISKNSNAHKHGTHFEVATNIFVDGSKIFIKTLGEDLYEAIDKLKDKVMENVSQKEDKKRTKFRNLWRKIKDRLKSREKFDEDADAGQLGSE